MNATISLILNILMVIISLIVLFIIGPLWLVLGVVACVIGGIISLS